MADDAPDIGADFDIRAATYSRNQWHRAYAEGLVAHARIAPGDRVLDAGVGTGFAAIAAAAKVGPTGYVVGVDLSTGMLAQARAAIRNAGITNVDTLEADATDLTSFGPASFDAVICAAALLYMPVERALGEWHRVLKPGGIIGFSTTRAGFPKGGQLFRECASRFGVRLTDPSAPLGTERAAVNALERAGFVSVSIVADCVAMRDNDFAGAWESNLLSTAHAAVRGLNPADLESMREEFERALKRCRQADPSFGVTEVLFAYGEKPLT